MAFYKRTLAAFLLPLGILMGQVIRTAHAGVAVSPLKQEISLKPGEQADIQLNLSYNNRLPTDVPQKVTLALFDVQVTPEGALVFKDPATLSNSASKWVTLNASDVLLEPGAAGKIACHLSIPESAAPGEYYAAVMVTLASKGQTEKGVSVQYRIASGLFVTVLGRTFPREARIAQAELAWPQPRDLLPATAPATMPATAPATAPAEPPADPLPTVKVLLENTGKARFDATGKLTILDNNSRIVFVSPLGAKRPTVFGGDSRLFDAPLTKALPAGQYTFRIELDYQSAWSKARQELHIDILPEQAALLAQLKQRQRATAALVEASPDNLASTLPPGASRSLAITVKNVSDAEVSCSAAIAATSGTGAAIVVQPEQFTLAKGARKTVEVRIQGAATPGRLSAMVNLEANQDGGGHSVLSIPVDVQPKSEK